MAVCLLVTFSIMVAFTSCSNESADSYQKIAKPKNNKMALLGTWKIEKEAYADVKDKTNEKQWIDKKLAFTEDSVVMGQSIWANVTYKIKNVNGNDYFLYNYNIKDFGNNKINKQVLIVTLTSEDKFISDFVMIDENNAIAVIDDTFFYMIKTSDKVDSEDIKMAKTGINSQIKNSAENADPLLRSGVLLGIKSLQKNSDDKALNIYAYKTIWISSKNKVLNPILEMKDIFLPRKSGFWKVDIKRVLKQGINQDVISAYNIVNNITQKKTNLNTNSTYWSNKEGTLSRSILFISNDYICTEITGEGKDKLTNMNWGESNFKMDPIDNISNIQGINIKDISGDNGLSAFINVRDDILNLLKPSNILVMDKDSEEDFSLQRRTGHWFIKGRLNYSENNLIKYQDFNVNILPTPEVVPYDTLYVPWTVLKNKLPEALDIYTSPNKDIAIVTTAKYLYVYAINSNQLSENPLKKIALQQGDTVIMAEWGLGGYVDRWQKSFSKGMAH